MKARRVIECGLWTGLATGLLTATLSAQPPEFPLDQRRVTPASHSDPWSAPAPFPESSKKPLPARSSSSVERPKSATTRPTVIPLWGTVAALGVMAVGVILTLQWLRRHGPAVLRALPNEAVEPLGQRVLSRGVAVHLVRCGSRMLLLGVGPDGVRTLVEIDDPVEVDILAGACRRRDESSVGLGAFAQLLQRTPPSGKNSVADRTSLPRYSGAVTEVDGV